MIGIYGGTFNPIHYGHLRTALEVKECFELDQLRLIPCRIPALKQEPDIAAEHRLQMMQLATENCDGFSIDNRELLREGRSYMIDTLKSLRSEFPNTALFLFIGTDAFAHISSWREWQSLFNYAHIIVMTRPGFQYPAMNDFLIERMVDRRNSTKKNSHIFEKSHGSLYFQNVTQLDISSSIIRELIKNKRNPQFLLPDSVAEYIHHHQLYRA